MPTISFKKSHTHKSFTTAHGTPLMKALLDQGVPVSSSCLGEGVCSKCRIRILEGQNNLSTETELEIQLRSKNKISDEFRISCQTRVLGDISIDTDYW